MALEELDAFYGEDYLPFAGPAAWGRWSRLVEVGLRRTARARARLVERLEGVGPGARALDVGCGRPFFVRELARRSGARVVGWDRSDAGWRDSDGTAEGVALQAGPLEEALRSAPFDAVTLWHVLEHVSRPVELLASLLEATRPGGFLVVEVPDHSAWTRRAQGAFWAGYDPPRHVAAYDPGTLRDVLERAGWEVVRLRRRGTFDPWLLWWLGRQGRIGRDLTPPLDPLFPGFLLGKVATWPLVALSGGRGLGLQTAVARAPGG